MVMQRKLLSGETETEELLNRASQTGLNVIELLLRNKRSSPKIFMGFDVPEFQDGVLNPSIDATASVTYIQKQVLFNPDKDGFCWGYVIDTPKNRDMIAKSLKTGWFRITDKKIEDEIKQYAEEHGIDLIIRESNLIKVKKTPKEEKLEVALEKAQKEMLELKKALYKKEAEIKPLQEILGTDVEKE